MGPALCIVVIASLALYLLDASSTSLVVNMSRREQDCPWLRTTALEILTPGDLVLHSSHAFVGDSDVGGLVMLTELLGIKRVVITLQVEFHTLIQLGAIIFKFYCAVILKHLVHV